MRKEKELTIEDCYKILNKYKAPELVIKHSEGVAKAAFMIGKKMNEKRRKVDLNTLVAACLLHDLFKVIEIRDLRKHNTIKEVNAKKAFWERLKKRFKGKDHEEAFEMEFGKKYPTLSRMVVSHKYSQICTGFASLEDKIIYYSDKLVQFDKITTLKARLDDAKKRYAYKFPTRKDQTFIEKTNNKIFALEKEIFKTTGLKPKDLIGLNDISLKELILKGRK